MSLVFIAFCASFSFSTLSLIWSLNLKRKDFIRRSVHDEWVGDKYVSRKSIDRTITLQIYGQQLAGCCLDLRCVTNDFRNIFVVFDKLIEIGNDVPAADTDLHPLPVTKCNQTIREGKRIGLSTPFFHNVTDLHTHILVPDVFCISQVRATFLEVLTLEFEVKTTLTGAGNLTTETILVYFVVKR